MKKRKVKRYEEGGILRDSSGNPVRSGSGEVVRTRFPEGRKYDEQASASMTESSDYTGRRMKSPEDEDKGDSSYAPKGKMGASDIGYGGGDAEAPARGATESAKTFKQSFAAARRAGDKTFEFGGKKYSTEMAAPKAKASAPDESSAETARIKRQASEASKASYGEEKQRQARMAKEQALQTVSPETALIGGGGLRAMKMLAEGLAARQAAKEAAKTMGRRMEKDITPRPPQLTNEPLKIGRESLKLGMKKGGAVKKMASGGSVSSASKRADGIAQRGKTKGRIC
jgi:hypothetical protein